MSFFRNADPVDKEREWGCGDPIYHRAIDGGWVLEAGGIVGRGQAQGDARASYMRQWNERESR